MVSIILRDVNHLVLSQRLLPLFQLLARGHRRLRVRDAFSDNQFVSLLADEGAVVTFNLIVHAIRVFALFLFIHFLPFEISGCGTGFVNLILRARQHILVDQEEVGIFAFADAASFILNEHLLGHVDGKG